VCLKHVATDRFTNQFTRPSQIIQTLFITPLKLNEIGVCFVHWCHKLVFKSKVRTSNLCACTDCIHANSEIALTPHEIVLCAIAAAVDSTAGARRELIVAVSVYHTALTLVLLLLAECG
jgi:hypothetical protein